MAGVALGGKAGLRMAWIVRVLKIGQMAAVAVGRGSGELIVLMASRALHRDVGAR